MWLYGFAPTNQALLQGIAWQLMVELLLRIKTKFIKMKNLFLTTAILFAVINFSANAQSKPKKFKHIVTVTFTENAPQSEVDAVDKSFKGLSNLKVVKAYEWGVAPITDRNKENKHTYAFTFASLEDLDKYATSPEHQKHITVGVSITKKVEAVQYFVEK
jgi:hypothetical protein